MNRLQANQVYITLEGVNSSPQMLKHSVRISLNQMDENDRRLIREAVKDIRRGVHAHHVCHPGHEVPYLREDRAL